MRTRFAIAIFVICLALYAVMNYGGIRSPDSEIVFRTGESIESNLSFDVPQDLERWSGFGLAPGKDGRLYSVFGPLQSIGCAPVIRIAKWINRSRWYESSCIPIQSSHWKDRGLMDFVRVRRPQNLEAHALRFIVSFFNTVVSALGVFLFWLIITKMVSSLFSAAVVTLLYAFGTLTWPYSGTFLSEPLAVLFVLISFYLLISDVGPGKALLTSRFLSGLSLGIAAAAHIAAILFAPFFSLLSGWFRRYDVRKKRIHLPALACLLGGLVLALAPLGCYNYARFGAFLETGRTVSPDYASKFLYGQFVPPWQGIYGLLLSGGKGLLFYCPAVVAGILCWGKFHRKYASLSIVLASAIVFRMIFIASRSDWHGGFCLGPRYLLMIIPFLLIGIGIWLDEQLQAGQVRSVRLFLGFAAACVAQQVYFCIGEIFSYLHLVRWAALFETGVNLIENDRLYLSWSDSPLFYLLREKRGPWLLQQVPLSNEVLWVVSTLLVLLILAFVLHCAFRYTQSAQAESSEQANNELKLAG